MPAIHYGSNSQAKCGAADGLVSQRAAEVTCRACRDVGGVCQLCNGRGHNQWNTVCICQVTDDKDEHYTRNQMVEVLTALWDMQQSPDCWCDSEDGSPLHSPACSYARDVTRKYKALAYPERPVVERQAFDRAHGLPDQDEDLIQ